MKYITIICILVTLFSCDDGNLQIETLDFDSVAIQDCGDIAISKSNVLFKISDDEALILSLPSGLLKNEVTTTPTSSAVPSGSQIKFRIFSDNVSQNYFCDEIPPTSPTVIDEISATGGEVLITSTTIDSITFTHNIALSGISLETSDISRITDLRINNFGEITTTVEE